MTESDVRGDSESLVGSDDDFSDDMPVADDEAEGLAGLGNGDDEEMVGSDFDDEDKDDTEVDRERLVGSDDDSGDDMAVADGEAEGLAGLGNGDDEEMVGSDFDDEGEGEDEDDTELEDGIAE